MLTFEWDARTNLRESLVASYRPTITRYLIRDLWVPGDLPQDLSIEFWRHPPYETYGLAPHDYPLVYSWTPRLRKHAFCAGPRCLCKTRRRQRRRTPSSDPKHSGPLCLWYPRDERSKRWTYSDGLYALVEIARRHLFFELEYSISRIWLGEEAPHGIPGAAA